MPLVEPTDYRILAYLAGGERNNAVNIAVALDLNRPYVNTRLRTLSAEGYLRRVGPAEQSGLYEITDEGVRAIVDADDVDADADMPRPES